jgi:hypothetical protein
VAVTAADVETVAFGSEKHPFVITGLLLTLHEMEPV